MIPSIHFAHISGSKIFKSFFYIENHFWCIADGLDLKHMRYSQMLFDLNKFVLIGEV